MNGCRFEINWILFLFNQRSRCIYFADIIDSKVPSAQNIPQNWKVFPFVVFVNDVPKDGCILRCGGRGSLVDRRVETLEGIQSRAVGHLQQPMADNKTKR